MIGETPYIVMAWGQHSRLTTKVNKRHVENGVHEFAGMANKNSIASPHFSDYRETPLFETNSSQCDYTFPPLRG